MTLHDPHSAVPLSARGRYDYENSTCISRVVELPNDAEISPTVALEKRQGTESGNTYNCPIIDTFRLYLWKTIAPKTSNGGTPNLKLRVRRVYIIDRRPHPLPIIYVYGASASNYTIIPVVSEYQLITLLSCSSAKYKADKDKKIVFQAIPTYRETD